MAAAQWTPQAVIAALIEAYIVLSESTGRVGPRGMKAFWPEYQVEFADLTAQAEIARPDRFRRRRGHSALDIQRMEMALLGWTSGGRHHPAWLNGNLLVYERLGLCLAAIIISRCRGFSETELCRQLGWSLARSSGTRGRCADDRRASQ